MRTPGVGSSTQLLDENLKKVSHIIWHAAKATAPAINRYIFFISYSCLTYYYVMLAINDFHEFDIITVRIGCIGKSPINNKAGVHHACLIRKISNQTVSTMN